MHLLYIHIYCLIAVKRTQIDDIMYLCERFEQFLSNSGAHNKGGWEVTERSSRFRHFYFLLCYQKQNTANMRRQRCRRCLTVFYTNSNSIIISQRLPLSRLSASSLRSSSTWGIHIQIGSKNRTRFRSTFSLSALSGKRVEEKKRQRGAWVTGRERKQK